MKATPARVRAPRGPVPLVRAFRALADDTRDLCFGPPAAHVYRPLDYAWPLAEAYAETFGAGPKEVVLVGMNPGPFGMGQTGVPFGEVAAVRDWMKLRGDVRAPVDAHPKRPVLGLACARSEVSGRRLWSAVAAKHPDPQTFFARAFVLNYCPLLFLDENGANVTPDKLRKDERGELEAICDRHLAACLDALGARVVVGIGIYAAKRIGRVRGGEAPCVPHPSPASPAANRGWEALARAALDDAGASGLL